MPTPKPTGDPAGSASNGSPKGSGGSKLLVAGSTAAAIAVAKPANDTFEDEAVGFKRDYTVEEAKEAVEGFAEQQGQSGSFLKPGTDCRNGQERAPQYGTDERL